MKEEKNYVGEGGGEGGEGKFDEEILRKIKKCRNYT